VLALPQGVAIQDITDVDAQTGTRRFNSKKAAALKPLFEASEREDGTRCAVQKLGMEVTDFSATADPVPNSDFELICKEHVEASGKVSFKPLGRLEARGEHEHYVLLHFKGSFLKLIPSYKLIVNPLNPVIPERYTQELYLADKTNWKDVTADSIAFEANGQIKKVDVDVKFESDALKYLQGVFENAVFGMRPVDLPNGRDLVKLPQRVTPLLKPEATAPVKYGGQDQTITIKQASNDAVTFDFAAETIVLKPNSAKLLKNDPRTLLHCEKIDGQNATIAVYQFNESQAKNDIDFRFRDLTLRPPQYPTQMVPTGAPAIGEGQSFDVTVDCPQWPAGTAIKIICAPFKVWPKNKGNNSHFECNIELSADGDAVDATPGSTQGRPDDQPKTPALVYDAHGKLELNQNQRVVVHLKNIRCQADKSEGGPEHGPLALDNPIVTIEPR
jgi:hypothetical protein